MCRSNRARSRRVAPPAQAATTWLATAAFPPGLSRAIWIVREVAGGVLAVIALGRTRGALVFIRIARPTAAGCRSPCVLLCLSCLAFQPPAKSPSRPRRYARTTDDRWISQEAPTCSRRRPTVAPAAKRFAFRRHTMNRPAAACARPVGSSIARRKTHLSLYGPRSCEACARRASVFEA
jgi:hypothetical protein